MRKQYPATLKAKIVLELLKEEKSLPKTAVRSGIHNNQLRQWQQRVEDELPSLFSRKPNEWLASLLGTRPKVIFLESI